MKLTAVFLLAGLAFCQAGNGNAMERFVSVERVEHSRSEIHIKIL